jgi:N-acetyl sugar amidotransferase
MIQYCTHCVMPSTKPDLKMDAQGVCNACRNYENRKEVDWAARRRELEKIFHRYRSKDGSHWDCIVPVSGGKDSTYQVIKALEFGMTPLCVTATTCDFSDLGKRNVEALKRLGVDHVQFSPNPIVRRKLNRIGLREVGDISWPEHVGIFTIPVRAAVNCKVPLILWGENSQNEYGGPAAAADNPCLDRRWLEEFGGLLGLRVSDCIGLDGLTRKDLIPYFYPTDEELKAVQVTGLFLGHYLPWDGLSNAMISKAYGLETFPTNVEGSMLDYENLDNHMVGLHDYFKFLKFGFGRATDHACLQIRRKRITREEGIEIVKRHDGKFPWTFLGKPIEKILEPLDLTVEDFEAVCDRFTNKKIFLKDDQKQLLKDRRKNLTKINYDNA